MPHRTKPSPYRVQVLDRALRILDALAEHGPELSLGALAETVHLHKSTAHRLATVLERNRLIDRDGGTGRYRLGLKLFELGSRAVAHIDLAGRAAAALKRLVFDTGETAHLCILDRGEVLSLSHCESPRTIRTPSTVGRRTSPHCTSAGKALLAHLPEEELDEIIARLGLRPYTRKTITVPAQLKLELERVRERGWALDDEEVEENLRCIGAPVRNLSGSVVASISIAGPAFRLTSDAIPMLARSVVKAADQVSTELGYAPPQAETQVEQAAVRRASM